MNLRAMTSMCRLKNNFTLSYGEFLKKSNRHFTYIKRLQNLMTEVSKIINGHSPDYLSDLFITKHTKYDIRDSNI